MQYCTACRLVTPKQVVSGRLEVLCSADNNRRSCLHFAGEPVPEDADGETETVLSASKVRSRPPRSSAQCCQQMDVSTRCARREVRCAGLPQSWSKIEIKS